LSFQKFEEDDLKDSLVVDKQGYICGYVSGFKVGTNKITASLYGYEVKNTKIPDQDELIKRLYEFAPRKGMLNRKLSTQEFYDWIKESLNLPNNETVKIDHMVKYASDRNIVIPMKTEKVERKVAKGAIDWFCVNKIAFTDLGKCVLLDIALEGKKRGDVSSDKVSFMSTEEVAGKLVIDSEGKIVGSASKFLIGSPPGLSIILKRVVDEQKTFTPENLKRELIPSRFRNEKELLTQIKKDLNLKSIDDYPERAIVIWAKKKKIKFKQDKGNQIEDLMEITVSWDKIAGIHDVALLKEPIESFIEKENEVEMSVS